MDENSLREQAREVIRTGQLPGRPADRTWGGPGSEQPCAVCRLPLHRQQPELELEFVRPLGQGGPVTHHLHVDCCKAWRLECIGADTAGPKSLSAQQDEGTMRRGQRTPTSPGKT